MSNFYITLTDRKPFSVYSKRMIIYFVLVSVILMTLLLIFNRFTFYSFFAAIFIGYAVVTRMYMGRYYMIEPYFSINNDFISYRLHEYVCNSSIDSKLIAKIKNRGTKIDIFLLSGKRKVINLNWIPSKYVVEIVTNITKFANDKGIIIEK